MPSVSPAQDVENLLDYNISSSSLELILRISISKLQILRKSLQPPSEFSSSVIAKQMNTNYAPYIPKKHARHPGMASSGNALFRSLMITRIGKKARNLLIKSAETKQASCLPSESVPSPPEIQPTLQRHCSAGRESTQTSQNNAEQSRTGKRSHDEVTHNEIHEKLPKLSETAEQTQSVPSNSCENTSLSTPPAGDHTDNAAACSQSPSNPLVSMDSGPRSATCANSCEPMLDCTPRIAVNLRPTPIIINGFG